MKCDKKTMLLYAVTDRMWIGKQTLYEQIEDALRGGVTCVQLREKKLDYQEFLNDAIKIKNLCKKYNVPFFINDNVEIAIKCGADGVHIGQKDMCLREVRSLVGKNMIIGVSVHNVEEAIKAVKNGADYLGVGAVFSTSTKRDAKLVSIEVISDICNAVDVPVVAIGGLNKHNISKLFGSGVDGIAIISAIFSSDNIEKECRELYRISKDMVDKKQRRF